MKPTEHQSAEKDMLIMLKRAQQFTGDYIDHAETWEMCAVAELDADLRAIIADYEDGTYECANCGADDHPSSECQHGGHG